MNDFNKPIISTNELRYLKTEFIGNLYCVSLVDSSGYGIVKGYGTTVVDAINDMHSALV